MLSVGDEVDRYVVEAVVGEGGMARVYRVRHTTLDTPYALKVLTITSAGLRERLVAEGKAQAKLVHENVLRVIDVIDIDGAPGLIMDYVDGPDLHQWIAEHEPDVEQALAVFHGILAGIRAAHQAGMIHRDLKPANVLMVEGPAGRWVPKVCDFGLVKALAGEDSLREGGATRAGLPMGTPSYMPPEQIRDASTVDERADVFALGCILFELLAHERAYDGDDPMDIFDKVRAGKHAPLPANAPAPVAKTIQACLVSDREARLATVDDVQRSLSGEGTAARVPAPRTLGTGVAASPNTALWVGAAALATGGLVVAVVVFFVSMSLLSSVTTPTCEGPTGGWVRLADGGLPRDGGEWLARSDTFVHDDVDGTPICTLPAGSTARIAALADPLDPSDPWVQLAVEGMTVAAEGSVAPDVLPVCYGPVRGWAVSRSVFTRPRKGATTWSVRPSQVLLDDRPTEANDWSDDHGAVCALPAGAEVVIDGNPETVRGRGTWIPVREVR